MARPVVVLHYNESGELNVYQEGHVQVLTIDERAPGDRVHAHVQADDSAVIEHLTMVEW